MPEQDLNTTKADHAEEVLDVVLPADHEPTKMMQPSETSLYTPTPGVAAQGPTVLRRCPTLSAMRCNHLDAVSFGQISIQAITVVGFVADQS